LLKLSRGNKVGAFGQSFDESKFPLKGVNRQKASNKASSLRDLFVR